MSKMKVGLDPRAGAAQGVAAANSVDITNIRTPLYGQQFLRQTRMRLRQLALGESSQLIISSLGDSYSCLPTRWMQPFTKTLQTTYGNAGIGYISFCGIAFNGTGYSVWDDATQPQLDQAARSDLVTILKIIGTWAVNYNSPGNATANLSLIVSNVPDSYIRFTVPAGHDAMKLYYRTASGTETFQVSWDDGSTYSSDITMSTVGTGVVTVPGIPGTDCICRIKNTCTAGVQFRVSGVELIASSTSGVRVNKLGVAGSQSNTFAQVGTTWRSQMATMNPTLVTIMFGTNDQGFSLTPFYRTPAEFYISQGTIVDQVKLALPAADILIISPPENQRTNNVYPMAQYTAQSLRVAVAKRVAHLDLQSYFGDNSADYAWSNAYRPWFASDLVHPVPETGGRAMTDAILRMVIGS